MRRLRAAAVTAAVAVLPFVPGTAGAEPGAGPHCGFASVSDQFSDRDVQYGEMDGGPIVVDAADPASAGSIVCTIQASPDWLHSGPDRAVARSLTTPGVAYLPPTPMSYVLRPDEYPVFCTQVDVAGGPTYYLDATDDTWSTSPDVPCLPLPPPDPPDPPGVDPPPDLILCPLLAILFPPQGDIPGIWDCPPYES